MSEPKLLSELFESIGKVRSVKERRDLIDQFVNESDEQKRMLKLFIECTFHPNIVMELPFGPLPKSLIDDTKETSGIESDRTLYDIKTALASFVKGAPQIIENDIQREASFTKRAASLIPGERKILEAIKDKSLPDFRGLTKNLLEYETVMQWLPFDKFLEV